MSTMNNMKAPFRHALVLIAVLLALPLLFQNCAVDSNREGLIEQSSLGDDVDLNDTSPVEPPTIDLIQPLLSSVEIFKETDEMNCSYGAITKLSVRAQDGSGLLSNISKYLNVECTDIKRDYISPYNTVTVTGPTPTCPSGSAITGYKCPDTSTDPALCVRHSSLLTTQFSGYNLSIICKPVSGLDSSATKKVMISTSFNRDGLATGKATCEPGYVACGIDTKLIGVLSNVTQLSSLTCCKVNSVLPLSP